MKNTNKVHHRKHTSRVNTKPLIAVDTKVGVRVRVTYWIGLCLFTVGAGLTLLGVGLLAIQLPLFPGDPHIEGGVEGQAESLSTANTVSLLWTAPGDDGNTGQAQSYDIRYSTAPITAGNFATSPSVSNPPKPSEAGQTESMVVAGLQPSTTYYFALKSYDESNNSSSISNIASVATTAASCVPQWSCTDWSFCRDNTQTRTCVDIANPSCNSNVGRPVETQSCTGSDPSGACVEDWTCTAWSACTEGVQTRVCTDRQRCGTTTRKPTELFDCSAGGAPAGPSETLLATVPARNTAARVRVFTPTGRRIASFLAYDTRTSRGGTVAIGDTDGDNQLDIVTGTGAGATPFMRVFNTLGKVKIQFSPFPSRSRHGLRVGTGDVDGDGVDEIFVTPYSGASARIRMYKYNPATRRYDFKTETTAVSSSYRGGVRFAFADLDRDDRQEMLVVPASASDPVVRIYKYDLTSRRLVLSRTFRAFPSNQRIALNIAAGDVENNGDKEIIVSRDSGAPPTILVFNTVGKVKYSFNPTSSRFRGGVAISTLDRNGDGQDEIVTSVSGSGSPGVFIFEFNRATRRFVRVKNFSAYGNEANRGVVIAGTE